MREATIILPFTMTAEPHILLRKRLLATFGGYTEHEASGTWIDPAGVEHRDRSLVFTIAVRERPFDCSYLNLTQFAREAGRLARQQCVYVRGFDGEVEFIDCQ